MTSIHFEVYAKRHECLCPSKAMHTNVHGTFLQKNPKLENDSKSIIRRADEIIIL